MVHVAMLRAVRLFLHRLAMVRREQASLDVPGSSGQHKSSLLALHSRHRGTARTEDRQGRNDPRIAPEEGRQLLLDHSRLPRQRRQNVGRGNYLLSYSFLSFFNIFKTILCI